MVPKILYMMSQKKVLLYFKVIQYLNIDCMLIMSVCDQLHYQNKHCNYFFVLKANNNKDISILLKSRIANIPCWHEV